MEFTSLKSSQVVDLSENDSFEASVEKDIFLMISWNIDGLSEKNLRLRTEAVCKYVKDIDADIVFLQEVVPESQTILEERMKNYLLLFGGSSDNSYDYFTAIGLKKSRINCMHHEIVEFQHTDMNRNLITANV